VCQEGLKGLNRKLKSQSMEALFQKLASGNAVIIVPQVTIEQDGHPILCHRYDIFKANGQRSAEQIQKKVAASKKGKIDDIDYLGELTFEIPGKLFSYTFHEKELSTEDAHEIIDVITNIRENPSLWSFDREENTKQ
jgi:hypothetical protein